ncbi:MAG: anthranilate synthase component I, partial [Caldilineae bacterium]
MIVSKIQNTAIPVVRTLPADLETTISVYLKLAGEGPSFLLESVTGGEQVARYSFIGVDVQTAWVLRADAWERHTAEGTLTRHPLAGRAPLQVLQTLWQPCLPLPHPDLPRFVGGLVGYLGYETVRYLEPTVALAPDAALPEAVFLEPAAVVAFDHARDRLLMIALAADEDVIPAAEARLDALQSRLRQPLPPLPHASVLEQAELQAHTTRADFLAAVETAREHIAAGDIFQVVLSQRFSRRTAAHPFAIYRA